MLKRLVLSSLCIAALTWIAAKADVAGIRLLPLGGTSDINAIDEQLHRRMKWSHGAYFVMDEIAGQPTVFYSLDRNGIWTHTVHFQNPEPAQFGVFGYDRESDGTIVFSGETWTAPRVASPFLAWTSADGQTQPMMRTEPYFPYEVSVTPDGSIWTLGFEIINLNPKDPAVNEEAHVLRHFDRAASLIGSAFPQSRFDHYQQGRLDRGLLVVNRDRLGWYRNSFQKRFTRDSDRCVGFFTQERRRCAMSDTSQFNTDRSYPGRWTITFSNPPINMFVPTTILELGALMTDIEAE